MSLLRAALFFQSTTSVAGSGYNEFVDLMSTESCINDGQCGTNGNQCCSGASHSTLACGTSHCEPWCEKIAGYIKDQLESGTGCVALIAEGVALCEAIGLGPENPFADICAAIVVAGCPIISHYIGNDVPDAQTLCNEIGVCAGGKTGKRCGCLQDSQCTTHAEGCCSGSSHFTMACPGLKRCDLSSVTWYRTITPAWNTGLCLDLPSDSDRDSAWNGAPLQLWECNGGESQRWVFDNGQLRFGADETKCIDAGDMSNGNQLFLWDCNGAKQQTWNFDSDAGKLYLADTATCVDLYGDAQDSGQAFHIWDCSGDWNQQWSIWNVDSEAVVV